MKLRTLIRRDLARSARRLATVGSLVAVGVAVIMVLGGLGVGVYRGVIVPLLPKLPLDVIKVEPRVLSLGVLAFDASSLGGGRLDAKVLARLEKIDGVAAVYPVVGAGFPLRAQGGAKLLGRSIRTDLFATGIDPALVTGDIAEGYRFEDPGPSGEVVPVVVARRLLDLYNSTVAPAIGQPKLSAEAIVGFSAEIVLGSSYVRGTPDPSKVQRKVGQIVGVSDQATLVGISVPEATVRRWNDTHSAEGSPIVGAYVRTRSPTDAGPVAAAIERAGLAVDDTLEIAGAVVASAGVLAGMLVLSLLLLAGFAIAQTFFLLVAERRSELAVLRAMGARRRDLRALVLIEALIVGVLAGFAGVAIGVSAGLIADNVVLGMLPDIPFKPDHLIAFPIDVVAAAWSLGVAASVLGAFVPAIAASRADPADALRA